MGASASSTRDFMKVDSAVYSMSDGTKLVYFVLSNEVNTSGYQPFVEVRSFTSTSNSKTVVG